MNLYQILCILGIPTLIVGIPKLIFNQVKGLRLGVQALLRTQMLQDYHKYSELGYAPIYARENFQNCWNQYHALGVNGVMDDIHDKFLELPIRKDDAIEIK